jgi:hypothetical protein
MPTAAAVEIELVPQFDHAKVQIATAVNPVFRITLVRGTPVGNIMQCRQVRIALTRNEATGGVIPSRWSSGVHLPLGDVPTISVNQSYHYEHRGHGEKRKVDAVRKHGSSVVCYPVDVLPGPQIPLRRESLVLYLGNPTEEHPTIPLDLDDLRLYSGLPNEFRPRIETNPNSLALYSGPSSKQHPQIPKFGL